jgi:serine/threonine protein kinase/tetratricopeptide (TPR) repeat protein
MTDSSRRPQADDLFHAAIALKASEREAFVRTNTPDEDVVAEVLALLRAHDSTGRFDALVGRMAGLGADQVDVEERDPERIGPYRVLRRIGRGGMGAVYLAERDDGQFEHRVAIKVLRADRAGPELRRRFLTERRILAQLTHENIAWLLDGNVTEDGSPYLVMEYVDGKPFIEWCDERHQTIAQRLALFLEVCSAVEYAHRRLVIHRDLKPGNILVTDAGAVKLLDFGIAKLLEPEQELALPATRTGLRLMTPEYASPEQIRGDTVGTPSDVYQLGVLLYELLTGRRPYAFDGSSLARIEAAILSTDPVRPSAAVTAAPELETVAQVRGTTRSRLNRRLAGDLDHIILKSLRKEPDQRYGSVTALAEDVRRHLEGLPVLARRGTVRYRAARFVRRHRVSVGAAALVVLSLVAGIIGTSWQAARASEQARIAAAERDRAQLETEKARRITEFLTGLFDVASEGNVRTDTLRLLPVLERGAAKLDEELHDQPEVRTAALIAVSDVYQKLGRYEEALRHGEEALRQRRETLLPLHADIAHALDNLGGVVYDRGEIQVAQKHWEEAVTIRRANRTAAGATADSTMLTRLAMSLHNLAAAEWRLRNLEVADTLEAQSIALRDSAGAGESRDMARSLDLLALVRSDQGKKEEALEIGQRALEIRRTVLEYPHSDIASSLNNLAVHLTDLGRLDEAEAMYRESLEIRRAVLGAEHPQVATAVHNLGAILKEQGEYEQAIEHYREAHDMRVRLLGERHLDVALSLSSLALLYHERGRYAEALPLLVQSIPIWQQGLGPKHGLVLKTQGLVGDCLSKLKRYPEAERELHAAYVGLLEIAGENHNETKRVRAFLEAMYRDSGRPGEAARFAATSTGS